VVGGLEGAGNAGPEQAGALSLVYGSFADADCAQRGFRAFAEAQRSLLDAPGFLRWLTFADGPHGYGLGWWRSADDATAWARGSTHRELVTAQRSEPFELSQFAGIWTAHALGRRYFYCPRCGRRSVASEGVCACGEPLDDGFAPTST
jgi:heme-degrading monooxygenase HmoA